MYFILRISQMTLTFANARSKDNVNEVTEERDSDDEAENTPAMSSGLTSGLRSFLPSFSNSKYARAHRRDSVRLPPGVREPEWVIKNDAKSQVEPKVWLANESKSKALPFSQHSVDWNYFAFCDGLLHIERVC